MRRIIKEKQKTLTNGYVGQAYSFGNAKLPKNHMIVNLSSATNCPSKELGFCQHCNICYAYKAEHRWPNVRNKNLKMERFHQGNFENVKELVELYIENAPGNES